MLLAASAAGRRAPTRLLATTAQPTRLLATTAPRRRNDRPAVNQRLLRLVDDDKQSGLAQMPLTDMFTRSFSRGCSVSASPAASSSMDP